ncbi:hypothetical protein PO909_028363 [Leuciscus waleckii]
MGVYFVFTLSIFLVGVFGDEVSLSVLEGDSVTLNTGVTKQQRDKMLWYFNHILIAQINGHHNTSCLYDGEDGRFRDRLEVDYETGSLTITNIRSEHAGRFEANFIQSKSSGTSQSLNQNSKCDSTKIIRKMSNIGDTIKIFIASVSNKSNKRWNEHESEQKCQGLSLVVVAGTAVAVLLVCVFAAVVVACVIYYRCRSSRKDVEKNNQVL